MAQKHILALGDAHTCQISWD